MSAPDFVILPAGEAFSIQEVAATAGAPAVLAFSKLSIGARALLITTDVGGPYKFAYTTVVSGAAPANPTAPTVGNTATADGASIYLLAGTPFRIEAQAGSNKAASNIGYFKIYCPANTTVYLNWLI